MNDSSTSTVPRTSLCSKIDQPTPFTHSQCVGKKNWVPFVIHDLFKYSHYLHQGRDDPRHKINPSGYMFILVTNSTSIRVSLFLRSTLCLRTVSLLVPSGISMGTILPLSFWTPCPFRSGLYLVSDLRSFTNSGKLLRYLLGPTLAPYHSFPDSYNLHLSDLYFILDKIRPRTTSRISKKKKQVPKFHTLNWLNSKISLRKPMSYLSPLPVYILPLYIRLYILPLPVLLFF